MRISDYFGKGRSYSRAGQEITFGYIYPKKTHSDKIIEDVVRRARRGSRVVRRKRRSRPAFGGYVPYMIRIRT